MVVLWKWVFREVPLYMYVDTSSFSAMHSEISRRSIIAGLPYTRERTGRAVVIPTDV